MRFQEDVANDAGGLEVQKNRATPGQIPRGNSNDVAIRDARRDKPSGP